MLIQSPEDQTSTIIAVGDRLYATSNNLGRLYRIGRDPVSEGTYVSPVRDTRFAGQWGVITWRGTGNVELQTRSGNTETPIRRGAIGQRLTETRPATRLPARGRDSFNGARCSQELAGRRSSSSQSARGNSAPAQLQSVVVAYLPRNQAPDIGSVSVMAPGVAFQEMPLSMDPSIASSGLDPQLFGVALNVPPRRYFQKGARTLTWQASDPNDDTLAYKVFYRTLGDNEWHVLAGDLTQPYYTIDGNRLPDGTYLFRIVATDAPGNPPGWRSPTNKSPTPLR